MIIPTVGDFENTMQVLTDSAKIIEARIVADFEKNGRIEKNGALMDSWSSGSTAMHLDRRKPLFKFFSKIENYSSEYFKLYISGGEVNISLKQIFTMRSYTIAVEVYDLVVEALRTKYEWEIFKNVDIN